MARLRFGLIGGGVQGCCLSEAARLSGAVELVACADLNRDAAERAASICGYGETFVDSETMLSKANVDAVIVATAHDQLQPMGMQVVRAGKHLFIEKPMALTAAAARELVAAAAAAGVKMMVGYTLPFMAPRVRMKQLLAQGAVGDIALVFAGQIINPLTSGWLADAKRGGGPLFYVGTHVIYQVLDVVERRARRVYAEVSRNQAGVEEACLFTVHFDGGVVAQIATSQQLDGRYGWIDVVGTAGRMRSEWERPELTVQSTVIDAYKNETVIFVPEDSIGPQMEQGKVASLMAYKYIRAWASEFQDFIGAINEDRQPAVTGEDGLRVLEITDAIIESGRTAQPVELH